MEVLAASASLHQETNTVTTATAASSNTTVLTGNSGGDADALRSNNIGGSCGGDGTGSALEVQGVGLSGPQPGPLSLSQARPPRVNKISAGGIFGEAAFFLDFPQSVRCVALQAPPSPSSTSSSSSARVRGSSWCGDGGGDSGRSGGVNTIPTSSSSVIVLWTLDRASYLRMETRHPQLCLLIQHALLKVRGSVSVSVSVHFNPCLNFFLP